MANGSDAIHDAETPEEATRALAKEVDDVIDDHREFRTGVLDRLDRIERRQTMGLRLTITILATAVVTLAGGILVAFATTAVTIEGGLPLP